MGLDELRRLIAESDQGDWNVIDCFNDGAPSFLASARVAAGDEYSNLEHHGRATYRPDVSIGLAWGMKLREYKADWLDRFTHATASFGLVDLYNGMLVDREDYVVVDSGRAKLPAPRSDERRVVTDYHKKLVKLIDEFDFYSGVRGGVGDKSASEFEDYFRGAEFEVD